MSDLTTFLAERHQDWDAAWALLTEELTARYGDDPKAFAKQEPALLKALKKWPKQGQQAPADWLWRADARGHLLSLAQGVTIYPEELLEPWDEAMLCAALAAPLSRARSLYIESVELTPRVLKALCNNPALTQISELAIIDCKLSEQAIAALLDADALWASLTALTLSHRSVNARCAALLASSPRLARLKSLTLQGCALGPAGRAALGASPHLSSKIKTKLRLPIGASNTSALAPPAPGEAFGELRSLLSTPPTAHTWARLCDLFDHLDRSEQRERVAHEALPYAQAATASWPAELCVAPAPWLQAAMDGRQPPAGLALARTLRLSGDIARVATTRKLAACPQLANVEVIDLSQTSISGTALGLLLDGAPQASLRSLDLGYHDDEALGAALMAPRPKLRLESLAAHVEHVVSADPAARELALSQLKHLRLSGHERHASGWGALLRAPWLSQLETLELGQLSSPARWQAIQSADALPTRLRSLGLGAVHLGAITRVARWLSQCDRLEALSVFESSAPGSGSIAQHVPPSLRSLTLGYNARFGPEEQQPWRAAALPALRSLSLRGEAYTYQPSPETLLGAPWMEQLDALDLQFIEQMIALPKLIERAPALRALSITRSNLAPLTRPLDALTQLERLSLRDNSAPLHTLSFIAASPCWPKLRALSFSSGYEDDDALLARDHGWARALPAGLDELEIACCPGLPHILDELLKSPAMTTLRALTLRRCGLNQRAMQQLVEALPDLKRLERLDLSENSRLNEAAVKALASSPQLSQLSELRLRRCYIGVRARALLLNAPHISLSAKAEIFSIEDQR